MKEITEWQDSIFTQATPLSAAIHLTREALEVQQSVKLGEKGWELDLELADVFLLTVGIAHLAGIDLEAAIDLKMFHNRNRTWGAPDADGVVEHVRGPKTLVEVFVFDSESENLIKNIFMEDEK